MKKTGTMAFVLAVLLYGALGSPTPDTVTWVEVVVLAALAVSAVCGGITAAVWQTRWSRPLLLFVAYGALAGAAMGVLGAAPLADVMRDGVAFMALAMPIAFYGHFETPAAQRHLTVLLVLVGLMFSARYVWSLYGAVASSGFDFLYLANSSLVTFAGAFLLLWGSFAEPQKKRAALYMLLSALPVVAMAGMMQRATLALLAAAFLLVFAATLKNTPRRALVVAVVAAGVLLAAWPAVSAVAFALLEKTNAVGWNTRDAELQAVFAAQSQSPVQALLGAGWGSAFKSPAVGDQWVRFTHGFFTSVWWKTGWLGLLLSVLALGAMCRHAYTRLRHNMPVLVALAVPLVPALFLYGSYKSLCFGLLLLGLVRADWTIAPRNDNHPT